MHQNVGLLERIIVGRYEHGAKGGNGCDPSNGIDAVITIANID